MFNNIPVVTKNILILNILVYVVTMVSVQLGNHLDSYLAGHYINSVLFEPYQVITHMFSHSTTDIFHILFNMILLVMFGGFLERVWGPKRYFIFYIACGIGAFVLYNTIGFNNIFDLKQQLSALGNSDYQLDQLVLNHQNILEHYRAKDYEQVDIILNKLLDSGAISPNTSESPMLIIKYIYYSTGSMVGASGAVFGLLAGFAILFPNTELNIMFIPIPIKAKYLIGVYLAYEIYSSFYASSSDNTAHLAHVGGAIVGAIMVLYWRKFDKSNFY